MRLSFILFRYFSKTFLLWFLIFMAGVLCIILLFDLSEILRRASSRPHVTLPLIIEMVFLRLPFLGQQLLPFVVLFSTMFALWRLNRGSEIIVTRAAGVSIWQMLSPVVLCALFIGLFDLGVINPVSSMMMSRYKSMNSELFLGEKGGISVSETGIWLRHYNDVGSFVMRVGRVDLTSKTLSDVMILEYVEGEKLKTRINASQGVFKEGGLSLQQVWVLPINKTPAFYHKLFYKTDLTPAHLKESNLSPETLGFWELPHFISLLEKSGLSSVQYKLHWHALLARVFWLAAMVILAATCSLRPLRQGGTVLLIISGTAIGFVLYFLKDITNAMGQSSTLPVLVAAWAPVFLSGFFGMAFLLHLEDG